MVGKISSQRFSRGQKLKLRTTVPLSYNARAMATDEDTLNRYYDILDETGLPPSPKSLKVVNSAGSNISCVIGNDKSQITVLARANATG